ncbi:MAG: hypothetical protein AB8I08_25405 [Sandaracinaceae bacterium]
MATRKTSQAQQATAANPFATVPGAELWKSMMEAQNARFEKLLTEMEKIETERHTRALHAFEDMSNLVKTSMAYQQQLSDEWRKMSLDTARKVMHMATPEA